MNKVFGFGGALAGLFTGIYVGGSLAEVAVSVALFGFMGLAAGWSLQRWLYRNTGM